MTRGLTLALALVGWGCTSEQGGELRIEPAPAVANPKPSDPPTKPDADVIVEVEGSKMIVNPEDVVVSKWLREAHVWEPVETLLYRKVVRPGHTVVDIGANIGYYSLLGACLVGDGGRVFAFEPDPEAFSYLERNIELNGYRQIEAVRKAVGAKAGTVELFLHETNRGDHRVYDPKDGRSRSVAVPMVTLDAYFRAHRGTIDLIKIDTQGAECAILEGAHDLLVTHPEVALVVEYTPKFWVEMGADPMACLLTLQQAGFEFHEIREFSEPKGIYPVTLKDLLARFPPERSDYTNLFLPARNRKPAEHDDKSM